MSCETLFYIAFGASTIVYLLIVIHIGRRLRRTEADLANMRATARHYQKRAGAFEAELAEEIAKRAEAEARLEKFDHRSRKRGPDGRFEDTPEPEPE